MNYRNRMSKDPTTLRKLLVIFGVGISCFLLVRWGIPGAMVFQDDGGIPFTDPTLLRRAANSPKSQPGDRNSTIQQTQQLNLTLKSKIHAIKSCVTPQSQNMFSFLTYGLGQCILKLTNIHPTTFHRFLVGRFREEKVYLPINSKSCVSLTVGVGGDSKAEESLLKKYPGCKMYGVDPGADQGEDFSAKVGKFVPFGLSITGGNLTMTLRTQNGYQSHIGQTLTLRELVDEHLDHQNIFHFVSIDIEQGEYELLPDLLRAKTGVLAMENIAMCQIDLELHFPNNHRSEFASNLILESEYIPIYGVDHIGHRKVTLVNYGDNRCVDALNLKKLLMTHTS